MSNLTPDLAVAEVLFRALRDNTADGPGITREAYGRGERIAHSLVYEAAEAIGLDSGADPAGNLYMTLPGSDPALPRLLLGSHLDSVRGGGNYDGAAGVLAGLATVAGLKRAGFVPSRDVTVMVTRAEEAGAWFPTSYPGARAALGTLRAEELEIPRQDTGRTLADHMTEEGFEPDFVRAGNRLLHPGNVAAYLELHIEQGPVLDAEQIPVGIVTGIPGSRRLRAARVHGEWNHSGATPRRFRRDAAIALAEFATRLDETWASLDAEGHELVLTFCTLGTTPEAGFTRIAGEAAFQLDVRSVAPATLAAVFDALHRHVADVELARGVTFDLGPETGSAPAPMDPTLQSALARSAAALGIRHRTMPSGGGHDAAAFAAAGIPAAMLFVRNQGGSHNPHEAMRMPDFADACAVMTHWVANAAA